MSPTKGSVVDLDSAIDQAIGTSESQQAGASGKPATAKTMATRGIQLFFILILSGGIVYKMFFSHRPEKLSKNTKKVTKSLSQSKVDKNGKTKIAQSASVETIFDNKLENESLIKSVAVPKLQEPKLPDVPSLKKFDEEEKEDLSDSSVQKTTNVSSEIANNNDSNLVSIEKEQKELLEESDKILGKSRNLDDEIKDREDKNTLNSVTTLTMPGTNERNEKSLNMKDIAKKAMEEMFVLVGNGPKTNESKDKNKNASKDDFVIFDGSNVSVKENLDSKATTQRISNLDNTITTGKILEAILETAINSEMPGMVRAVVAKDVKGEIGNKILIPKGSRIYGTYTTTTSRLQSRLAIMWNKVLRPDGVVVSINAQAVDQFGRTGIEGDVDARYLEMFQNSLLLSFITLGTAVALEKAVGVTGQSQVVNANGSVSTGNITPVNAAAQSMISTAKEIATNMSSSLSEDVNAIISIPHGMLIKVMVNQDITIPAFKKASTNYDWL